MTQWLPVMAGEQAAVGETQISARLSEACSLLKAMASETRLLVLCALRDGEKSVKDLAVITDQSLPAVSQHLAKLRAGGLVATRRQAQTIYYRVDDPVAVQIVEILCAQFGPKPGAPMKPSAPGSVRG